MSNNEKSKSFDSKTNKRKTIESKSNSNKRIESFLSICEEMNEIESNETIDKI